MILNYLSGLRLPLIKNFFRKYLHKLPLAVHKTTLFMSQADEKSWHEPEVNIPSIYMA